MWLYAPAVAATFANASIGETSGRKKIVTAEANERKTYERVGELVPVVGVVKLNDSVLYDVVCGCKTIQQRVLVLNRGLFFRVHGLH